ncbi:7176_t:CDS:2 [Rhizophagus irregularis]|nr:7176_t:CDS:2 [Rhizophagus irregularis]
MAAKIAINSDFGTTYSGFTYCHISDGKNNLVTNDQWPGDIGQLKTNTALQYDENYVKIESWGISALPAELFKLHLGKLAENLRPELPVDFKKAITDYLKEIGKSIKVEIKSAWHGIDFFENVFVIITVPAEYLEKDKEIMRECAYKAGLIKEKESKNLQFTTEPEAAAIYCMENNLKTYGLNIPGTTFMIVDCGGGTVDLTTRKVLKDGQLGEVTERAGDYCGSTFVDREFIKVLRKILGDDAIDLLRDKHYGQMQYMVQEFCRDAKMPFTGEESEFKSYEMDIEELDNTKDECSAMFLVGGFSQSKYLQKRIKEKFQQRIENISTPTLPIAAISRGATLYGLSMKNSEPSSDNKDPPKFVINERVLKYTYGIRISPKWKEGDPIERKRSNGRIRKFRCMARRGTKVKVNQEFTILQLPAFPDQDSIKFVIYYTTEYDAKYCDEDGMEKLGSLSISLPDVQLGIDRPIEFGLTFGRMEITATAKNNRNGQNYQATLTLDI